MVIGARHLLKSPYLNDKCDESALQMSAYILKNTCLQKSIRRVSLMNVEKTKEE